MSTIKVINAIHPSGSTNNIVNDASGNVTIGNNLTATGTITGAGTLTTTGTVVMGSSFLRNRIINGDMRIDQRNSGASVTPVADQYVIDRFNYFLSQASKFTAQQNGGSVTPPAGFTNYMGLTVAAAANVTVGASDYFGTRQMIEGYNVSDLGWGSANAKTVTLSFWVRSSLTGTMGGALTNSSRSYPFTYTISAANTWEQKTITVAGDTSGTWNTTNGIGIEVRFALGGGSSFAGTAGTWANGNFVTATGATNIISTNNATFYITGVQLEVGSVATPFERRQYGQELALCQRYYCKSYAVGVAPATTSVGGYAAISGLVNAANTRVSVRFPVEMRSSPTIAYWDYVGNASKTTSFNGGNTRTDNVSSASTSFADISASGFSYNDAGGTGNSGNNATASIVHWTASIEL